MKDHIRVVFDLSICDICRNLQVLVRVDNVELVARQSGWLFEERTCSQSGDDIGIAIDIPELTLSEHYLSRHHRRGLSTFRLTAKAILVVNPTLENAGVVFRLAASSSS